MKARLAASAVLALGLAIGATGCSMVTYQATTEHYDASDGVSVTVGDLDLRNILVVSEDGEDGNLVMTVVNTGDRDQTLKIEAGSATQELDVDAHSTVALGSEDTEPLLLEGIDAEVGGLTPIFFQYASEEGIEKQIPVLDDRLYPGLAP
ncbi:hypothetical protein SAMN05428970_1455 [Agromyces sp. CF514]|uniref:hypothetical protein n=1 Tax=Agromyces sp. CF514 TaxID=1881031 RepID=UPI0008E9D802|nr:hypothetical protein [Agromyces sp. CF514]SFR72906.1 hypothetical protein SAMN05428970_1455 [Agromyces sp. CF514]